jgi:hypothetical protein
MLWLQRVEVSGEWKKLPSKELEDVSASPDIIYGGACRSLVEKSEGNSTL